MEKLFLITSSDSITVGVVYAESKDQAIEKFYKKLSADTEWREHCDKLIINDSLLEVFFKDKKGYLMDEDTGDYRKDINNKNNPERYIDRCVEENAKKFFGERADLADMYLKMYEGELHEPFSDDFYYVALINLNKTDYPWFVEICDEVSMDDNKTFILTT